MKNQAVLGLFCCSAVFHLSKPLIKAGIDGVEILAVQLILRNAEGIAEALVMDDLALAEIFDDVAHVGIVAQAKNIVVGHARLLLGGKVFVEVCDDVALDAHVFHVKGDACGGYGVDACGVIHKIGGKGSSRNLLLLEISCELEENGGYHFQMRQLLGAYLTFKIVYDIIRVTT